MKINKAIREIMREKGISLGSMEASLGIVPNKSSKTKVGCAVSARLNSDNMTFNKAIEMLNILGYEIVVQKKQQGNRRADQLVINQIDEEPKAKVDLDALLSTDEKPPSFDEPPVIKKKHKIKLK